jgi:hypothetical protein
MSDKGDRMVVRLYVGGALLLLAWMAWEAVQVVISDPSVVLVPLYMVGIALVAIGLGELALRILAWWFDRGA